MFIAALAELVDPLGLHDQMKRVEAALVFLGGIVLDVPSDLNRGSQKTGMVRRQCSQPKDCCTRRRRSMKQRAICSEARSGSQNREKGKKVQQAPHMVNLAWCSMAGTTLGLVFCICSHTWRCCRVYSGIRWEDRGFASVCRIGIGVSVHGRIVVISDDRGRAGDRARPLPRLWCQWDI